MIGKLIGALVGERMAKRVGGVNDTTGALLGAGAAAVLRRFGPLGLAAAVAGGYAAKKIYEKRRAPVPAQSA